MHLSIPEKMCNLILTAPSNHNLNQSNIVLSKIKEKFYKKFKEGLEYLICCGTDKTEISIF